MSEMFPNEDTTVTCGRHPGSTCTQAHDSHVSGLIERDHEIEELRRMVEEMGELLESAQPAWIDSKHTLIFKTEGGEEEPAVIIPAVEHGFCLEDYRIWKEKEKIL